MGTEGRVTLLISSKHPALVEGIRKLLNNNPEVRIVGEVKSPLQAAREAVRMNPDCVLMDVDTASPATTSAIRQMRRANQSIRIWLCSLWEEEPVAIASCLEAGANGFVSGSANSHELRQIFRPQQEASSRILSNHYYRGTRSKVAVGLILLVMSCSLLGSAQEAPDLQGEQEKTETSETAQENQRKMLDLQMERELEKQEEAAKEEPNDVRHFYLSSPFTASESRENRLPYGEEKINDLVTVVSLPEITIANVLPRSEFFLSYHSDFEIFNRHDELNGWNHSASLRFSHEISPRWMVGARDSFLHTEDPTRRLQENIFLLPRSRFRENILSLNLDYLANSRTKYSFDFDNAVSYLFLRNLPTLLPSNRIDQMANVFTGSVTHKLAPQQRLTGSGSYLLFRDLNKRSSALTDAGVRDAQSASLTYEYGWDQKGVYLELSAGVLHGSSTSYTALSRIGHQWNSFSVFAGYSRQFALLQGVAGSLDSSTRVGSGLFPSSIAQVVTLEIAGSIKRHLVIDVGASAGKANAAVLTGNIKTYTGRARLAYSIGGRVFPFVGAEFYGQDFNHLIQSRMNRSRYSAGFVILLTPAREVSSAPSGDLRTRWPLDTPGLLPRRIPKPDAGELK